MIGSVVEACTSATMLAEVVIVVIIQAAPTAWTSPPKFEARLASQIARKIGLRERRQRRGAGSAALSMVGDSPSAAAILPKHRPAAQPLPRACRRAGGA